MYKGFGQAELEYGGLILVSSPVIPHQGAAAHKGAVRRCQGCRQY